MSRKTALITGGNSGIGLALAERLLEWDPSIRLCLACRNQTKAKAARNHLLLKYPETQIDLISIDVGSIKSVYEAAAQIKERYDHIDLVYLNAGIMPVSNVNWSHFLSNVFSINCLEMFKTGSGLLRQVDEVTADGYQKIFTTNLFGHFILIKEIQCCLGGPQGTSQIIWTSSSNAKHEAFSFSDIQHAKGNEPYSSSKYASDLVSVAINDQFNNKGIYSHTTCPGLVMTNITYGILPCWTWYLLLPIIMLLRLFMGNMTHTPSNGAEALLWLAKQKAERLDPMCKYHSRLSITGHRYTETTKLDFSLEDSVKLYKVLDKMEQDIRVKYKS